MGRVTQSMRARVERQGCVGLSDAEIRDIYYWLRFEPFVALLWTAAGVFSASAVTLWALVPVSAGGAILSRHPLDEVYMRLVRPRRGTAAIPESGPPRRFASALTSIGLVAAGACFATGATAAAYTLGGILLTLLAVQVASGCCVSSVVYELMKRMRFTS